MELTVELSEHPVCEARGFRFDSTTGFPTGLPVTPPVPVYPVRVTAGFIEVDLSARPPNDEGFAL